MRAAISRLLFVAADVKEWTTLRRLLCVAFALNVQLARELQSPPSSTTMSKTDEPPTAITDVHISHKTLICA